MSSQRTNTTDYTKIKLDDDGDDGEEGEDKEEDQVVKITYDEDPFPEQLILWFVGEINYFLENFAILMTYQSHIHV